MIDYEQKVQTIINSIITFSFEFDFETVKKEMELQEVSKEEIEKLGEEKVREKFNSSIFKIKLPNGTLIDANSIAKHSHLLHFCTICCFNLVIKQTISSTSNLVV